VRGFTELTSSVFIFERDGVEKYIVAIVANFMIGAIPFLVLFI
jgi:hypothetical protein